jgi:hypothetical protein
MHIAIILNVDSTYMLSIYGQSMIIWHLANLLVSVSTVAQLCMDDFDAFKLEHDKKVTFFDDITHS